MVYAAPLTLPSGASGEGDVIVNDGGRPDRDLPGGGQIELHKLDLVLPHLPEEVLEHLDRELLSWAASIAKAERGEPRIVDDR